MLTPVTYRVVGESHIVLSLDTGRVYGPDLVIMLTARNSMCVSRDGIRRRREQVHRHRGRSRRPSGSPGCQRRPDAVCPRLSVAAVVSRSGIMATGRNDLRGFQPDKRAGKVRTFPARLSSGPCGDPLRTARPSSRTRFSGNVDYDKQIVPILFETIIYTPCSLDLKIKIRIYICLSL